MRDRGTEGAEAVKRVEVVSALIRRQTSICLSIQIL